VIVLVSALADWAFGRRTAHIPHSDRLPTTLESEILYGSLDKQKAIERNVDRTHPHWRVATSIGGLALPHNKVDKAAFADAAVLSAAFLLIVRVLHRSILIRQSSAMMWGYDGGKAYPKTAPIQCEFLADLRSLCGSTGLLVEIAP